MKKIMVLCIYMMLLPQSAFCKSAETEETIQEESGLEFRIFQGVGTSYQRLKGEQFDENSGTLEKSDFVGLAQIHFTSTVQLGFKVSQKWAIVTSAQARFFGVGADSGHFKSQGPNSGTIIYESAALGIEGGVSHLFDKNTEMQLTFGVEEGIPDDYYSNSKLRDSLGTLKSERVNSDRVTKASVRVIKNYFGFLDIGLELTPHVGLITLSDKSKNTYSGIIGSLLLGIKI